MTATTSNHRDFKGSSSSSPSTDKSESSLSDTPTFKKRYSLRSSRRQDTSVASSSVSASATATTAANTPPLTPPLLATEAPGSSANSNLRNNTIDEIIDIFENINGEREWAQFTISQHDYKKIRSLLAKYTNREKVEEEQEEQASNQEHDQKENHSPQVQSFAGKRKVVKKEEEVSVLQVEQLRKFLSKRNDDHSILHLRYEYISQTSTLSFRMPSIVHDETAESFRDLAVDVIKSVIRSCPDDPVKTKYPFKKKLLHGIKGNSNRAIQVWKVEGKWKELYPDASIRFRVGANSEANEENRLISSRLPGVIFEIGYSQTFQSLRNYVRYYLLHADKGINKVVIVKIDPKTRRTFLEVWERYKRSIQGKKYWHVRLCKYKKDIPRENSAMEIRGLDGTEGAQIDETVKFTLGDLVPFTWLEKDKDLFKTPWELSMRTLYQLLNDAFDLHDEYANRIGSIPPNTPTSILHDEDFNDGHEAEAEATLSPSPASSQSDDVPEEPVDLPPHRSLVDGTTNPVVVQHVIPTCQTRNRKRKQAD